MATATVAFSTAKQIPGDLSVGYDASNMKILYKTLTMSGAADTYATSGLVFDLRPYSKDGATEPSFVKFYTAIDYPYTYKYDSANHKLLIYTGATGLELGNGTNIGAKTVKAEIVFF